MQAMGQGVSVGCGGLLCLWKGNVLSLESSVNSAMLNEVFTGHGREKFFVSLIITKPRLRCGKPPPESVSAGHDLGLPTVHAMMKPCVGLSLPRLRGHPEYRFPLSPLFNQEDVFQSVFCKHQHSHGFGGL